jgi:hypothetical protein
MGVFIYLLVAILWGGFTMFRWERECSLDNEEYIGATAIGLFWIGTLPFYLVMWTMKTVASKIKEKVKEHNE